MEQQQFIDSLSELTSCGEETKQKFAGFFSTSNLLAGQLLESDDGRCCSIFFILQGLLVHETQKPVGQPDTGNGQQKVALEFYKPQESVIAHRPSNIRAILPTTILCCELEAIGRLCQQHPPALPIVLYLQKQWADKMIGQMEMLHLDKAICRYRKAREQMGDYFYHIPHQMLASYISVSRKTFYRINRKLLRR